MAKSIVSDRAFQEAMRDYLADGITAGELALRIGDQIWADVADEQVDSVALAYAEFTNGHLSEQEFRQRVLEAATH